MTSRNQHGVNIRKFRKDAVSIGRTVAEAAAAADEIPDYGTLAYYIGGIATGVIVLKEDGAIKQGTGKAWAEACGVGDTEKGAFVRIVAKRRITLAKGAIAKYEARLGADGVSVDWAAADDASIDAAIRDILSIGCLESQYDPESKKKEDSLAKIVADAVRRAGALGVRYEDLVAAVTEATIGSGLVE